MNYRINLIIILSLCLTACFKQVPVSYDGVIISKYGKPMINAVFSINFSKAGKTRTFGTYKAATNSRGEFILRNNIPANYYVSEMFVNAGDSGSFSAVPASFQQSNLRINLR